MLIILFWNTIFLVWIIAVGFLSSLFKLRERMDEDLWTWMTLPLRHFLILLFWNYVRGPLSEGSCANCWKLIRVDADWWMKSPQPHFHGTTFQDCCFQIAREDGSRPWQASPQGCKGDLKKTTFRMNYQKSKFVGQGSSLNSYFKWIWNVENLIRLWFWWWRFLVLVSSSLL